MIGLAAISYAWTLEHGGKSAWLDELYVLPEHRSRGIGNALLEKVIEKVRMEGCRAIALEVEEGHRGAEGLYASKSFIQLRRRRWVRKLE